MKVLRSHILSACAASTVTTLVVGGIAWAAIPSGTDGNIWACYRTTGPFKGALRVIDHQAGRACNGGEAMLSWPSHGLRWRGTWKGTTTYSPDDAVEYKGSTFVSLVASNSTTPTPGTAWALLASHGVAGGTGTPRNTPAQLAAPDPKEHPAQLAAPDPKEHPAAPVLKERPASAASRMSRAGRHKPTEVSSWSATCPSGASVLSGGYSVSNASALGAGVLTSRPVGGNSWQISLDNPYSSVQVTAYAVCAVVGS